MTNIKDFNTLDISKCRRDQMPNLKGSIICKTLALVLCIFLAFEVSYLQAFQATDQMRDQFTSAKEAYFADDFEGAKTTLENLVSSIAQLEGMDSFKGEVYLLLGAAYEKLELNNLAIKYYCLAKDILGEEKTIEGLDLNSLTLYWSQCQTAGGVAISVLIIQYEDGYRAYLAGDYEGSKVILERLVSIIDTLEGFESLKGETYLVLGAAYEALKYKELAIKYYCKAKAILGVNVTVEGIRLSKLKWYKAKCPTGAAAARVVVRERRGGGGFIGFLLGLAILGGLIWYLFINENSPLKKDDSGGGGGGGTSYSSSCFSTEWSFYYETHWGATAGDVTFGPNQSPFPRDDNDWEDTVTYTLTVGAGVFNSGFLTLSLKIGGGDGVVRKDQVWVNDDLKVDESNTFTPACPNTAGKIDKGVIYTFNIPGPGTYTIKLRHKVILPASVDSIGSTMSITKK